MLHDFRFKGRIIPFFIFPVVNLLLSNSFTAVFALFFALMLYNSRRNMVRFFFLAITIIIAIFLNSGHLAQKVIVRFDIWMNVLSDILKNPLFGKGFDNSLTMNCVYSFYEKGMTFVHSDILNSARDLGIMFVGLVFLFINSVFEGSERNKLFLALVCIFVASSIQTNLYFPRIGVIAIILLALMEKEKCQSKNLDSAISAEPSPSS
jgi:hypothetical protein